MAAAGQCGAMRVQCGCNAGQRAGLMRADSRKTSQFKAFQYMSGVISSHLILGLFGRGYMIGIFGNAAGALRHAPASASMVPVSP